LQAISGQFRYSPLWSMFQSYIQGAQSFIKPGNELDKYSAQILENLNAKKNESVELVKQMAKFMCQTIFGYTVLDATTPRDKPKVFNYSNMLRQTQDLVGHLDPEIVTYCQNTLILCETVPSFVQANDWARVHQVLEPALKLAVDNQVFAPFQRPEFISNLEEDDLFEVKKRYVRRPNIVATAELALLK